MSTVKSNDQAQQRAQQTSQALLAGARAATTSAAQPVKAGATPERPRAGAQAVPQPSLKQAQQLVQALSPALSYVSAPPDKHHNPGTLAPRTEFSFAAEQIEQAAKSTPPKGTPANLKRDIQVAQQRLPALERQIELLQDSVAQYQAKHKVTLAPTFGSRPAPDATPIQKTQARLEALTRERDTVNAQAELKKAHLMLLDGKAVLDSAKALQQRVSQQQPDDQPKNERAQAVVALVESQYKALDRQYVAAYARNEALTMEARRLQLEDKITKHRGDRADPALAKLWQEHADLQAPLHSTREAADRSSDEAKLAIADYQVATVRDSVAELQPAPGRASTAQEQAALKDAQLLLRATLEQRQLVQAQVLDRSFESTLPLSQQRPQSKEDWAARNAAQFAHFQQHKEPLSAALLGQPADLLGHGQYLPAGTDAQQRNLIALALNLPPPQSTDPTRKPDPLVDWYTGGAAREAINKVQARIKEFGPDAKVAVMVLVSGDKQNGVTTMPLFKVQGQDGKTHYVDHTGAKYSSWQDFNENNKLSTEGTLVLHDPSGQLDADGLPKLSAVTANVTTAVEHVKNPLISAGLVIGGVVINGVAVVADSTGVGLVAGVPLHAVGTGLIVAGTVHGTASSVHNLAVHHDQGGSMSILDAEARSHYINIVASVTGWAGVGFGLAARSATAYATATRALTAEIIATNPALAAQLLQPLAQANVTALRLQAASQLLNITSNLAGAEQSLETSMGVLDDLKNNRVDRAQQGLAALGYELVLTVGPSRLENLLTRSFQRNLTHVQAGTPEVARSAVPDRPPTFDPTTFDHVNFEQLQRSEPSAINPESRQSIGEGLPAKVDLFQARHIVQSLNSPDKSRFTRYSRDEAIAAKLYEMHDLHQLVEAKADARGEKSLLTHLLNRFNNPNGESLRALPEVGNTPSARAQILRSYAKYHDELLKDLDPVKPLGALREPLLRSGRLVDQAGLDRITPTLNLNGFLFDTGSRERFNRFRQSVLEAKTAGEQLTLVDAYQQSLQDQLRLTDVEVRESFLRAIALREHFRQQIESAPSGDPLAQGDLSRLTIDFDAYKQLLDRTQGPSLEEVRKLLREAGVAFTEAPSAALRTPSAASLPANALLLKRAVTQPFVGPALTTLPQPRLGTRVLVVHGDIDRIDPSDLSPWAVPVRINSTSSLETGDLWKGSGRQQIDRALAGADIEGGTTIYRAWRHPRTDQLLFIRYDRNATHRASEQTQNLMKQAIPPGYPDFKAIHYTDETPHAVLEPDAVDARVLATTRALTGIAQLLPRVDTRQLLNWAADLPQRSQRQVMSRLVGAIPDANVPIAARWLNHFLMGSGEPIQMTRRETDRALTPEALAHEKFAPEVVLRAEIQRQIDTGRTSGSATGKSEVQSLSPFLGFDRSGDIFTKYVNAIGSANFTSLYKGHWQVDARGKVRFSGNQVYVLEDRYNFELGGFNGRDESPGLKLNPAFVNSLPPDYQRSFVISWSTERTGLQRYVMNSLFAHLQALRGGAKPFDTFGVSSERNIEATWDMR